MPTNHIRFLATGLGQRCKALCRGSILRGAIAATLAAVLPLHAANHPSRGLWVGEVVLKKVNEVTVPIVGSQPIAPDPNVATPTKDAANLRLIIHVDGDGNARLLKSVAIVNKLQTTPVTQTNDGYVPAGGLSDTNIALITDPSLYANFPGVAQRIAAAAFDFSDYDAVKSAQAVQARALAAATAAGNAAVLSGATSNTIRTATFAATAPPPAVTPDGVATTNVLNQIVSATYEELLRARFAANGSALNQTRVKDAATKAALTGVKDASRAAGAKPANQVLLQNSLTPGATVTGDFFLGAMHPTNPFRHYKHPMHQIGYDITRSITLEVKSNGTNTFERGGFGVDRLSGVYKEEIKGLHKLLGPDQNIGLKTEGTFVLNRVTLVDTLNR